MATFTWGPYGTSNTHIEYRIVITEGGVSDRNRVCNVKVQAHRTNTGYTTDGNGTVYVTINGTSYSNTWKYQDGHVMGTGTDYVTFFDTDVNVPCNVYGNGTISVSAYFSHSRFTSSDQGSSTSVTNIGAITYWTNINVLNPNDVEISTNGAYFDLNFSDGTSYANLTNEPVPAIYKPYGTVMTISNIRPFAGYALEQVTGATNNGNGTYSKTVVNGTDEINIHLKVGYTKCGVPTEISITDNDNNSFTVDAKVGSNGTQNNATGICIYATYDGRNPTHQDFDYTSGNLSGTTGNNISHTVHISKEDFEDSDYKGTVKIIVFTIGTQYGYNSDPSSIISNSFIYYTKPTAPIITRPAVDMTHAPHDFTVKWEASQDGINNPISCYNILLYKPDGDCYITTVDVNTYECIIPKEQFELNHTYDIIVNASGINLNFNSDDTTSSHLTIIDLQSLLDLELIAKPKEFDFFNDGTDYINVLHTDNDSTYSKILFHIGWNAPNNSNENVLHYKSYLKNKDNNILETNTVIPGTSTYIEQDIRNIRMPRESITSLYNEYKYEVIAINKYSDEYQNYDSKTAELLFRVYPASGMYVDTENGYKRAIGFKRLDDGSWIPLRELYYRPENDWVKSNINE